MSKASVPIVDTTGLAWLRERLSAVGYNEAAVCGRLDVATPAMLDPHQYPFYLHHRLQDGDPLATLIRLFLLQQKIPVAELRFALGDDAPKRLIALGLVAPAVGPISSAVGPRPSAVRIVRSQVDLYPYRGLWLATDRSDRCGGLGGPGAADAVMDLNLSSHALAQITLPLPGPGVRVLDLGTGCGLHALLAARAGAQAVGTDLNPRAVAFARFNAALNAVESIDFRVGDLYEPVAGETFDRILVNPAFILTPRRAILFRDGGPCGDAMSRRALVEAPAHLNEGGICQLVGEFPTIGTETFEERVTGWLAGKGCDLLLLRFSSVGAAEYAALYSQEAFGQSFDGYDRAWSGRWEAFVGLGIKEVVFGAVTLRRRAGTNWTACRPAASLEAPLGARIAAFFALKDRLDDPGFDTRLLEARPRAVPGLLIAEGRQWDGTRWRVEESHASVPDDPLGVELVLAAGARDLLHTCDGTSTTAQILAALGATDDPDYRAAVLAALRDLIERGLVTV